LTELAGYAGKILRVDLTDRSCSVEPLDPEMARHYLGGRGFNMRRLFDEVPPHIDALGPDNKVIFGVGPLNGTLYPGSRFNVSAKSPQTGILGDANAGGFFGAELKFAGYDQLIIEGVASSPCYLLICDDKVEIREAGDLWGLDVSETTIALRRALADNSAQVACIGPAGEARVRYSGVFTNLARAAARTGMGAVMGSKRLKAVVVKGSGSVRVADPRRFKEIVTHCWEQIKQHPNYEAKTRMGANTLVRGLNMLGALCTNHFQAGTAPYWEQVSGQRLDAEYIVRHKACFACNMPCGQVMVIPDGPYQGLMMEMPGFEALAGFTTRVGNPDLSLALKCLDQCNRYGADAVALSEIIAFCMELWQRGLLSARDTDGLDFSWGCPSTLLSILPRIVKGEGFAGLLTGGVREAARKIGRGSEELAMHTKGLELIPCDPRGIKGYGLGYAVASRGGDHLRSEPYFELTNDREEGLRRFGYAEAALRKEWKGKGRMVKYSEDWCAVCDSLNVCKNYTVCMEVLPFDLAAELLTATSGMPFSAADVESAGERIVNLERCYDVEAGITRADDSLPRRFLTERLPEGDSKGEVVELDRMLDDYYYERGWDKETGIPSARTIKRLGLDFTLPRLRANGVKVSRSRKGGRAR